MPAHPAGGRTVALVTLGCARNEVDSDELAGRLDADGFQLVEDPAAAETVLVNTCGFVESAKRDSIDALMAAADLKTGGATQAVVAVGCLAERYGVELARELPEADAVLGFDDYAAIGARLRGILDGERPDAHLPRDRRRLLPLTPLDRQAATSAVPGHGDVPTGHAGVVPTSAGEPDLPLGVAPASGPRAVRRRLGSGPTAPVKLASGCDRRCSFCAIPRFRGAFLSRRPSDVLADAGWLAGQGVRELFLVSENSTSYGKDLGDLRLLETLLPELAAVEGVARVRVSYLQPAEVRPSLVEAMTSTPGVVPYFDLSFQHASEPVLRRMRRFGSRERFLELVASIRARAPSAGIRSNVIVGFPGETEADLDELERFLAAASLDVVGVFGYSDEDGTEAATYAGKLPQDEIDARVERVSGLVDELVAQRAEDRLGEEVEVLVESLADGAVEGRAAHQGPEVDGSTILVGVAGSIMVGDLVRARVVGSDGADLVAEAVGPLAGAGASARRPGETA